MKWTHVENGAEVYTIYADLFLMLFMMAVLMMGTNITPSKSIGQEGRNGEAPEVVLSLYVDQAGRIFPENQLTILKHTEIGGLLHRLKTQRVILHTHKGLSMNLFGKIQTLLTEVGATEVSYIVEGESP